MKKLLFLFGFVFAMALGTANVQAQTCDRWLSLGSKVGAYPLALGFDGENAWVGSSNTVHLLNLATKGAQVGSFAYSDVTGSGSWDVSNHCMWFAGYNTMTAKCFEYDGTVKKSVSPGERARAVAVDNEGDGSVYVQTRYNIVKFTPTGSSYVSSVLLGPPPSPGGQGFDLKWWNDGIAILGNNLYAGHAFNSNEFIVIDKNTGSYSTLSLNSPEEVFNSVPEYSMWESYWVSAVLNTTGTGVIGVKEHTDCPDTYIPGVMCTTPDNKSLFYNISSSGISGGAESSTNHDFVRSAASFKYGPGNYGVVFLDTMTSELCMMNVSGYNTVNPQKDSDGDGILNTTDKCINLWTDDGSDQVDSDGDGLGDKCDACPNEAYTEMCLVQTTSCSNLNGCTLTDNPGTPGFVMVNIPEEAISEDVEVAVFKGNFNDATFATSTNTNIKDVSGTWFEFTPSPYTFDSPVRIVMNYPEPKNANLEASIMPYWKNPATGKWEEQEVYLRDMNYNQITFFVSHFSIYALFADWTDEDQDGVLDVEDMCPGSPPVDTVIQDLKPDHHMLDLNAPTLTVNVGSASAPVLQESTFTMESLHGCSCNEVLECKPGQNNGEQKFGCTADTLDVWATQTSWALECLDATGTVMEFYGEEQDGNDADSDGVPDDVDTDDDNDGIPDVDDGEDKSAPVEPNKEGKGKPDWWCTKHPTKC